MKPEEHSLSNKGKAFVGGAPRVDLELFFDATENIYHPESNPNGAFPLNMAENHLCWDMLRDQMELVLRNEKMPDWVASYTSMLGAPTFRREVARFLQTFLAGVPIDPEHLAFSPGASSVIEMTALLLGNPGDVAVFPAPAYPVYRQDVGNVAGMERVDLITHQHLHELKEGPLLSPDQLQQKKQELEANGKRFTLLVLTHPDNPTGLIYRAEQMEAIAQWCMEQQVHLVVNEIYGLSLLQPATSKLEAEAFGSIPFVSFLPILEKYCSPYLHWWYAFSKDFGISGFRVGVAYSRNQAFIQAYKNLNLGHTVSNLTQWLLERVLADHAFVRRYIQTNQELLTQSYTTVIQTLQDLEIPFVPNRGSLFVWIDFGRFLSSDDQEGEQAFWKDLYHQTGILLTPAQGFGHSGYGMFRLVHPFFMVSDLGVAMERLKAYLSAQE